MMLAALAVFALAAWAVFSRHFNDGLLAKHFLSFAAIFSFLVILDNQNIKAAVAAGICLIFGIAYAHFRPTRRGPLYDRRNKPRHP